jgi:hypothetical protein
MPKGRHGGIVEDIGQVSAVDHAQKVDAVFGAFVAFAFSSTSLARAAIPGKDKMRIGDTVGNQIKGFYDELKPLLRVHAPNGEHDRRIGLMPSLFRSAPGFFAALNMLRSIPFGMT